MPNGKGTSCSALSFITIIFAMGFSVVDVFVVVVVVVVVGNLLVVGSLLVAGLLVGVV